VELKFKPGETMRVKEPLFTISSSTAPSTTSPIPPSAPAAAPAPSVAPASNFPHHRTPLIKFKHGLRDETPGSSHEQVAPIRAPAKAALTEATQRAVPAAPSAQSTLASVGGMSFKRFLSQLEIDLIEMGGAEPYVAPQKKGEGKGDKKSSEKKKL